MGKDLNLCQFIGRLGKPPELRQTGTGESVANFSIACGDDYKKKSGEKVEQTNWINIVAWGRLAEICGEYLDKGSQIHISGKQVTRKWQDRDGNDKWTTEIVANAMQMLGSKPASSDSSGQGYSQGSNQNQQAGQGSPQRQQRASGHPQDPPAGFDDFDDEIPW